jgi:hypothetical protein
MENINMKYGKVLFAILCVFFLLAYIYCTDVPDTTLPPGNDDIPVIVDNSHEGQEIVKLPLYSGARPAIIFVVDHTGKGINENVTEGIIRLFAENKDTLSLAVLPFKGAEDIYAIKSLRYYVDAGIIDVNVNYDRICLVDYDAPCPGVSYDLLETKLTALDEGFLKYYGGEARFCVVGNGLFCEDTYNALEATGFKIVTASMQEDKLPSVQFTDFSGKPDVNGLVRLPFAGNVCARDKGSGSWGSVYDTQPDNELLSSVLSSLDKRRVAVIEISPEAFLTADNNVDNDKLDKLGELVQYSKSLGDIVTYSSWFDYMQEYVYVPTFQRTKETPAYDGGPAIIFRMDDGAKGWYEDTIKEIVQLFIDNDIPLEVGIIPYLDGKPSFDSTLLRDYYNNGVIDISMHGFDWTYAQMDTSQSGLTYSELLNNLLNSRQQIKNYYGVAPVTFTVPYDFFDETGYKAVINAGFKVFSTHTVVEPHRSVVPVDFNGNPDINGLYRIPTATDVTMWDDIKQQWGDVYDVSQFRELKYYPPSTEYHIQQDYSSLPMYHDFSLIKQELDKLGVAAMSIHPDAFITADGKPDKAKLEKLDKVIKWAKQFTSITTFTQWYKYVSSQMEEPEL